MGELNKRVKEAVKMGCSDFTLSLGRHKMPKGYALLSDCGGFFFWLHEGGAESGISQSKWDVLRDAECHSLNVKVESDGPLTST